MIRNVAASLLSFLTNIVIAFFLSPFILRSLGDDRYGLWAVFGEMLTYYGLLDFGVRGALTFYAGKALAGHKTDELQRYLSTAFYSVAAIAAVAFLVGTGVLYAFQDSFATQAIGRTEVVTSGAFFLFVFCLGLPLEVFSAVLVGNCRLYVVNMSEIAARSISTVLMFAVLSWKPSLVGLCAVQLVGKLVYWSLIAYFSRKYVPDARLSLRAVSMQPLRDMIGYGGQNVFINISVLLLTRKDILLIAMFWGTALVPFYAFSRILVQNITFACQAVTLPLRPNLILYWTRGEKEKAYEVYYTGARYSAFIGGMLIAFLGAYGSDFIRLWLGNRFVEGSMLFRADVVLILLMLASLPRLLHSISWQFLFATNTQKGLTILLVLEALVNVALSLILIKPYGLAGLGVASLVPMVFSHLINMPRILNKAVGVSPRRFITEGVGRPLACAAVILLLGLALRSVLPVAGWVDFFLHGAFLGLLALLSGATLVATRSDREKLMSKLRSVPNAVRAAAI